ncbi:hypothetical protein C8Q76DRAFT_763222 [Earliella scabrosa]|nr:hypothetical protein C8Q76DRAFT_763222 [Earliella scabrosa]
MATATANNELLATVAAVKKAVGMWKFRSFRSTDIPYSSAVYSLGSDSPLVEFKRTGGTEWTLCTVGTAVPAVLSHATIFADADQYETGNLVMGKEGPPSNLAAGKAVPYASYRCNYSYAFDTHADSDLYVLQSVMEKFLEDIPGFKPHPKFPRRSWQSGGSGYANSIFWMKTPMFLRHPQGDPKPAFPEHLHEWVRQAEDKSRKYRANPDRPVVRAVEGGRLKAITSCTPGEVREGDGVAITFTLKYIIGDNDWYPQYLLIDLVRVAVGTGTSPKLVGARYGAVTGDVTRTALEDGEVIDALGPLPAGNGSRGMAEPPLPTLPASSSMFQPSVAASSAGRILATSTLEPPPSSQRAVETRTREEIGLSEASDLESESEMGMEIDMAGGDGERELAALVRGSEETRADGGSDSADSSMTEIFEVSEDEAAAAGPAPVGGASARSAGRGKKVLSQKQRVAASRSGPPGTRGRRVYRK